SGVGPEVGPARDHVTVTRSRPMEPRKDEKTDRFQIVKLEERIAPSNGNFPPGQFPSGNPAHAPGQSNPNEVPATNPSTNKYRGPGRRDARPTTGACSGPAGRRPA